MSFQERYGKRCIRLEVVKDKEALNDVVVWMVQKSSRVRSHCNTRFHSGIKQKMAHTTWRDATTWMRKQAARERNHPDQIEALDRCRSLFGEIEGCDRCTESLANAFDAVEAVARPRMAGLYGY